LTDLSHVFSGVYAEKILTRPPRKGEFKGEVSAETGNPHHQGGDRIQRPSKIAEGVVASFTVRSVYMRFTEQVVSKLSVLTLHRITLRLLKTCGSHANGAEQERVSHPKHVQRSILT
jgi:hypothetical protein